MSYITGTSITPIKFADSPQNDAFGRLRISNPVSLIDTTFQYNAQPLYWQTYIVGNASTNHLPNEAAIQLSCSSTNGDVAIRQTYEYYRYQPGRSQQVLMTGVLGTSKANVEQRIGLFDASNGLFFKQDGSALSVVRRTHTSGTTVDNTIIQNDWNLDKMNGSGPSKIKLDISKAQIFVIDFEWLGVGRVRYGFNIDGLTYHCHQITNANTLDVVYMSTANLPLRYELKNVGNTISPTIMKQLCSTVTSEGGAREFEGIIHSVANASTGISVTTRRPILSIQPKLTFNGIVNRGTIILENFNIFGGSDILYEIVYDGSLSGANFISAGNNSIVNYDTTATFITGGDVIDSGFLPSSVGGSIAFSNFINSRLPLTLNISGTIAKTISVIITSLGGPATTRSAIKFREIY